MWLAGTVGYSLGGISPWDVPCILRGQSIYMVKFTLLTEWDSPWEHISMGCPLSTVVIHHSCTGIHHLNCETLHRYFGTIPLDSGTFLVIMGVSFRRQEIHQDGMIFPHCVGYCNRFLSCSLWCGGTSQRKMGLSRFIMCYYISSMACTLTLWGIVSWYCTALSNLVIDFFSWGDLGLTSCKLVCR